MIIILKSKVFLYSFKSVCCLAVENIFLKQRNASFLDRFKNGICREKALKYFADSKLSLSSQLSKFRTPLSQRIAQKQSGKKW